MSYDPTAYARKKAEAKEKADKLKQDREARKGELEAQAAERKAQMDALKSNKLVPPSTTTTTSLPAPKPAPAPPRPSSTSSGSSGGSNVDNSELLNRLQALETEIQSLKDRDYARQREVELLTKQVAKLETELRNERSHRSVSSSADDNPASSSLGAPPPPNSSVQNSPSLKPKATPPAPSQSPSSLLRPTSSIAKPAEKPKTPAPAPPAATPVEPSLPKPVASPKPEPTPTPAVSSPPVAKKPVMAEENEPAQEDLDELPVGGEGGGGFGELPEDAVQDVGELVLCTGCDRSFNPRAMKTHAKICKKVFQTKRKAFKVELIDPSQLDDFRPPPKKPEKKTDKKEEEKEKVPKWKQQTDQLRAALKAGRELQKALAEGVALKDIPVAAAPPQADDRVTCPHCARKFAEATAERHIPACKASKALKKK